jgi:hypothetical protein
LVLNSSINGFPLANVAMTRVTKPKSEEGNANPEIVRDQSLAVSGILGLSELFDFSRIRRR